MDRYFTNILKDANAVITAVGSLNYKQGGFDTFFDWWTKYADICACPVMISAVHITEADEKDPRFMRFKRAINRRCVKCLTTRDGEIGLENYNKYWREGASQIFTDFVADPALWIPEAYTIKKMIGINLIRHGLFEDYGNNVGGDYALQLYADLVDELKVRGYSYQLFSNGMKADEQFGRELARKIGISWKSVAIAKSGEELAKIVNGYDGVIAGRMHAMLTAAALRVPFAGFSWDSKISFALGAMGLRDNIISTNELSAKHLVDKLESVMSSNGVGQLMMLKKKTEETIRNFIEGMVS